MTIGTINIRTALLALLVLAALVAPSHAPALVPASGSGHDEARLPTHRAGEVLVRFRKGASPRARQRALEHAGLAEGARGRGVVKVAPGGEREASTRLARHPAVAWAEPNYLLTAFRHSSDEIPWTLKTTQGIEAEEVWLADNTGTGVRVAVVDSGVDATHPELAAPDGQSRVVTAGNPYALPDDCGHGTAVAGVIAAAHNGTQTAGVAPDATIIPVKVLTYDDSYGECYGDAGSIAAGIRWAADPAGGNADVINMSFGHEAKSSVLAEAITYAQRQGALLVAAAGDTGDRRLSYPAALPGVLSVGGLTRSGEVGVDRSPTTAFGAVDIAAPSHDVPVLLATQVRANQVGGACAEGDPHPLCADGTSFAAPHVAGVAALLVQQHGQAEPTTLTAGAGRAWQLRQWLLGTARSVPRGDPMRVKLRTGHGSVSALRARDISASSGGMLLTWNANKRLLSPTRTVLAPGAIASATISVSDNAGTPLGAVPLALTPPAGGTVAPRSGQTGDSGKFVVTTSSTAAGKDVGLVVEAPTATTTSPLRLDLKVLQHDENIRGVTPPSTSFSGSLDAISDLQDVFRHHLVAGERLEATATGVDDSEYINLEAFGRNATNVETGLALRENGDWEYEPLVLRRTATVDGNHYLAVRGIGSYRLSWRIHTPRRIRELSAAPQTFSPNGDGYRDRTRITWRSTARGRVTVSIADAQGRTRRTFRLGQEPRGPRSLVWTGRADSGARVRDGLYSVTVEWTNGAGRYSRATTRVRVMGGGTR